MSTFEDGQIGVVRDQLAKRLDAYLAKLQQDWESIGANSDTLTRIIAWQMVRNALQSGEAWSVDP